MLQSQKSYYKLSTSFSSLLGLTKRNNSSFVNVASQLKPEQPSNELKYKSASSVLDALALKKLDENLYASKELTIMNGSKGVFGGQIIGQALSAACNTVDNKFFISSMHSYFLLGGSNSSPIFYHVEPMRKGRSFATTRVDAKQNNKTIFTLTCTFQVPEDSRMNHQTVMPFGINENFDLHPAKAASNGIRTIFEIENQNSFQVASSIPDSVTIDCKYVKQSPDAHYDDLHLHNPQSTSPNLLWWYKAKGDLASQSPLLNQCAMAYHSDYQLVTAAVMPHGIGSITEHDYLGRMVSLDHSIWFHAPLRGDEWLLYHMDSHRASGGKALITGKLYNRNGVLVASVAQEGLFRGVSSLVKHNRQKYIASEIPKLYTQ